MHADSPVLREKKNGGSGIRGDDAGEEIDRICSCLYPEWVYIVPGNMPTNFGTD